MLSYLFKDTADKEEEDENIFQQQTHKTKKKLRTEYVTCFSILLTYIYCLHKLKQGCSR